MSFRSCGGSRSAVRSTGVPGVWREPSAVRWLGQEAGTRIDRARHELYADRWVESIGNHKMLWLLGRPYRYMLRVWTMRGEPAPRLWKAPFGLWTARGEAA